MEKKSDAPLPTGTRKRVLSHDEKANFWKPVKAGEQIAGKLLAVTETDKSPVLQMMLFSGEVKQVGVSTQLKRVPWAEYIGKDIFITFAATAKSKYGTPTKLFDVDIVE